MPSTAVRLLITLTGTLVLALPAFAERPSVNSINTELHRNRTAMCAKADADGDSYRPFVCDARCGCIPPDFIAELESCSETSPGTFVASQPDEVISNSCAEQFDSCLPLSGSTILACSSNSGNQCSEDSDCAPGASCIDFSELGFPIQICVDSCATNAQCPSLGFSCTSSFPCQFGCPSGWTCGTGGTCVKAGCTSDDDCDFVLPGPALSLAGVGSEDSPEPVTCSVSGVGPVSINSNDALACIEQIEAVTGACQ
jgi:hypothetical protein